MTPPNGSPPDEEPPVPAESLRAYFSNPSFFQLPQKIRVNVYSHCSAFTLLMLSHTSKRLHTEINRHPRIITSSFGIRDGFQHYYWDIASGKVAYVYKHTSIEGPTSIHTAYGHTLRLIQQLESPLDVINWHTLYLQVYSTGTIHQVCGACLKVIPVPEFSYLDMHAIFPCNAGCRPRCNLHNTFRCSGCPEWKYEPPPSLRGNPGEITPSQRRRARILDGIVNSTPPVPTGFPLPMEIRLQVYSHLPAFSLLQLASSSKFFYGELSRSRCLTEATPGFGTCLDTYWESYVGWKWPDHLKKLKRCGPDAPPHRYLTILHVETLVGEEEKDLFQRLYCKEHGCLKRGGCCERYEQWLQRRVNSSPRKKGMFIAIRDPIVIPGGPTIHRDSDIYSAVVHAGLETPACSGCRQKWDSEALRDSIKGRKRTPGLRGRSEADECDPVLKPPSYYDSLVVRILHQL
ncbi:hypothetical protein BJ508DRAFT_363883 [Ascobolus immersus RN42]|uniref:F-box domain-containing protein n=1 Tax=Ascobolus immersus RN42 TaxID=1160509 RepID=A0A3N4I0U3_ASCIM|nr:hypothetical protein BJ508DRAFT_363883 [Ascobolus immersus RN42]